MEKVEGAVGKVKGGVDVFVKRFWQVGKQAADRHQASFVGQNALALQVLGVGNGLFAGKKQGPFRQAQGCAQAVGGEEAVGHLAQGFPHRTKHFRGVGADIMVAFEQQHLSAGQMNTGIKG